MFLPTPTMAKKARVGPLRPTSAASNTPPTHVDLALYGIPDLQEVSGSPLLAQQGRTALQLPSQNPTTRPLPLPLSVVGRDGPGGQRKGSPVPLHGAPQF